MNNSFGIYDNSLDLIIRSIRSFRKVELALIFGSRAMGNYKKGSDIDIALKGKDLNNELVNKLSTLLNQELTIPYFVDILNYHAIENKDLVKHIDEYGIEVFRRDE